MDDTHESTGGVRIRKGLGYAPKGAVLAGSGKDASVLVPTDRQQPVQILNIHTGEATILPEPGTTGTGHYVEVASDGFVVLDIGQKQGMAFDSTGAVRSRFNTGGQIFLPAVSHDDTSPSADGSVLYADAFAYQDTSRYFIDMSNGLTYTSPELNAMDKTMWVFDDMLIGMTKSGIKAFVPASS